MRINIFNSCDMMGADAAKFIANKLNEAIREKGSARLLLSTGASQLEMFAALVHEKVDWSKVTMFHLDEYVGLPESHIASFRKYLKERFVNRVDGLKEAIFVNGEGDVAANIAAITARLKEAPIDVGVVGIGENGHIAFNDPPADFQTQSLGRQTGRTRRRDGRADRLPPPHPSRLSDLFRRRQPLRLSVLRRAVFKPLFHPALRAGIFFRLCRHPRQFLGQQAFSRPLRARADGRDRHGHRGNPSSPQRVGRI